MAISTYAELNTAVENWLSRADLTSRIPEFIALAEARFYTGSNPLRLTSMQARDASTSVSASITLPADYLETIRLTATSGGRTYALEYLSPDVFTQFENQSGVPFYYTLINGAIKIAPNNDVSYTHDYYERPVALETSLTNSILTNSPNIYLYGALLEAMPFIKNDKRIPLWAQAYDDAVNGVNNSEKRKFEASAPRVQVA
jgi:hypothetical protein